MKVRKKEWKRLPSSCLFPSEIVIWRERTDERSEERNGRREREEREGEERGRERERDSAQVILSFCLSSKNFFHSFFSCHSNFFSFCFFRPVENLIQFLFLSFSLSFSLNLSFKNFLSFKKISMSSFLFVNNKQ